VLALGQERLPVLEQMIEEGETWQDRLLADILVARIENPALFEEVEQCLDAAKLEAAKIVPHSVDTERGSVNSRQLSLKFRTMNGKFALSDFADGKLVLPDDNLILRDNNFVLPVLEFMVFIEDQPDTVFALAKLLVYTGDARLLRPFAALLDRPELSQSGTVRLIDLSDSVELVPELVALYRKSADSSVKKRIAEALGGVHHLESLENQRLQETIRELAGTEDDETLKQELDKASRSIQERENERKTSAQ
jgi:hypothetical protein